LATTLKREGGRREVGPLLRLLALGLCAYPFGGGGTFAGTAGGSPSAGARKFGLPASPGPTCGGDRVGGVEGAIDDGASAGATIGAAVGCGAVVTSSGGALSKGAGAVLAGRVAGASSAGDGGWAGTSNRSRHP